MRLLVGTALLVGCLPFAFVGCESPERPAEADAGAAAAARPEPTTSQLTARQINARGDEHLRAGRFAEAIADFDAFLAVEPAAEPHHWQRGIAYYYAGRFAEGVRQFESHRRVNPNDVENAVWHFLCKAQLDGAEAAREALLPVGLDGRAPLMQIYALFQGRITTEEVVRAIDGARAIESAAARFYGHLYLGLYHEVMDRPAEARRHLEIAATTSGGSAYMLDIARIHARRLVENSGR